MKLGVASDSSGNIEGLSRALDQLAGVGAERIFFLGGRYGDVDAALTARQIELPPVRRGGSQGDAEFLRAVEGALAGDAPVGHRRPRDRFRGGGIVRVASRSCPEYRHDGSRKVFELVSGLIFCLVHDKSELTREDIANATVLLHGNSDRAALVQIGPRLFITPGPLQPAAPRGGVASFALLDVEPAELEMTVYSVDGRELSRERAAIGGRGRISVK